MKMKRFMAGLMTMVMLTGCGATPALAYTGGDTSTETETVSGKETTSTADTTAADKGSKDSETTSDITRDTGKTATEDQTKADTAAEQPYEVKTNDDGSMTITYNGEEFTLGGTDDGSIGTGTVTNVNSYLNLRDGAGMSAGIIGHLLPGTEVSVLGEDGDWYKVSIPEQTGYVSKDYLEVALNGSGDGEMSSEMMTLLMNMILQGIGTTNTDSSGLTPDGNLTLVDDIGSSTGAGQQFITLTTKAGNVFYLVIDRDDDGNENVHFLNLVDEADLFALMDEDAKTALENQAAAETTEPETTATPSDGEDSSDAETAADTAEAEKKSTNWAPLMLLVIVMIAGIGGFFYVTMTKKKKQSEAARPDPDADYEDEDDAGYELPEDDGEDANAEDKDEQVYTDAPESEEDESEPDDGDDPV